MLLHSGFGVNLSSSLMKFFRLLLKSALDRCGFISPFLCRISSNVFGDAHGAKMRPAHGTKMSRFRAFGGKCFVVELAGGFGIECEIELIFPSELEASFADRVVAVLHAGMAFSSRRRHTRSLRDWSSDVCSSDLRLA